ncbi:MAG: 16S rRNA (cytosine(1402)-N(4))-methyltransferase RsmH [Alphaproteobacteria bacterium]|nr:16S rRNA (cytosine(1402)-N(4))-methyltransferase RsmH [Alphaproteobacteria bacterium]
MSDASKTPENAPGDIHIPVLRDEVVEALNVRPGGVHVDGTFGAGGYAKAILAAGASTVLGIDRDPDAIARGRELAASHPGLVMIQGRFGDLDRLARDAGHDGVDGVTLDLGVSSPQLDEAERGFSFRFDGPLDMRMERAGETAADYLATVEEADLAGVIKDFGEERFSRRVARAICRARDEGPITRTGQLADIIRKAVPKSKDGIDPATRTFQAIRIALNDELGELDRGLAAAERILRPAGRLAVVTFHSLEDRVVKRFLQSRGGKGPGVSRHMPQTAAPRAPSFSLVHRKPVLPGEAETRRNPRARSAKLRVAERTAAPAWGSDAALVGGAA